MKLLFVTFLAFVFSTIARAGAYPVKFMTPSIFGEEKFLRASDFFEKEPCLPGISVLRNSEALEGLYFVTTFHNRPQIKESDQFILSCEVLYEKDIVRFAFSGSEDVSEKKEIFLGITDSTWKKFSENLVAWQLVLKRESGETEVLFESFSW